MRSRFWYASRKSSRSAALIAIILECVTIDELVSMTMQMSDEILRRRTFSL